MIKWYKIKIKSKPIPLGYLVKGNEIRCSGYFVKESELLVLVSDKGKTAYKVRQTERSWKQRSEREATEGGMDPTPLCSSPSVLQICLVFNNWSILNDNVKTHLFFEFHFAAFPGKTMRLSITGKISATLILAGGHS